MARRGELKRLTPELRQRILDLIHEDNLSLRQIAYSLGVSRTTVRKLALALYGLESAELRNPIWPSPRPHRCPKCGFKINTVTCVRCRTEDHMDDQAKARAELDRLANRMGRRRTDG